MNCTWDNLLSIVPSRLRQEVDKLGKKTLEELHLRIGQPVELILGGASHQLDTNTTMEDIRFVVNTASRYSPWSATTVSKGYLTASGGHRIGLCGECVIQNGQVTAIREAFSLCIRVARDFPGIGKNAPDSGSLLILGPPGSGKTTLLRILLGEIQPASGHLKTGHNVAFGYYDQGQLLLNDRNTVLEELKESYTKKFQKNMKRW